MTRPCNLPNGCGGLQECGEDNNWGACECAGGGGQVTCTPPCGGIGSTTCDSECELGPCPRSETCNDCDDDLDGQTDEGLFKCADAPFVPLNCPSGSDTVLTYTFNSDAELPNDPNFGIGEGHYANSLGFVWRLFTNRHVQTLKLRFDSFISQWANDYLSVGSFEVLHGVGGFDFPLGDHSYTLGGGGQLNPVTLTYTTNSTITDDGFVIGQAKVRCGASGSQTTPTVNLIERNEGLLVGSGDTLFFKFTGGSEHAYIWMEGFPAASDFDLYVRNGVEPEQNKFSARSISTTNSEALRLYAPASGTWFIAVTSYSGAGSFRLRVAKAKTSEIYTFKAGTNFTYNPTDFANIKLAMERALRRYFGVTEGQIVVEKITLFNNGTGPGACFCPPSTNTPKCDICINESGAGATANCGAPNPRISIGGNVKFNDFVIAHELTHCPVFVADEYAAGCGHLDWTCGHTISNSLDMPWNNNWCTALDHGKDFIADGHVCTACNPGLPCGSACRFCSASTPPGYGWSQVGSRVVTVPASTPDNSSYEDFTGFGTLIQVVTP